MKSLYPGSIITLLLLGLLSACATPATNTPAPASGPTEVVAPLRVSSTVPTRVATDTLVPTDAAVPASSPIPPTQVPATASGQGATVSFASDILPLLNNRCANCHGGNRTEEGLNLLSYASIMSGSKNGAVVMPGDADNSLLVELLVSQEMPKRGPKLTLAQIQPIIDWINQGALDN